MALGTAFETTYRRFVAAWLRHDSLHRANAPVAELYASRAQLDALRQAMAATRHGISV